MVRRFYPAAAALYPIVVLIVFALTVRKDPFAIFEPGYSMVWLVFVPGVLILLTIGLAYTGQAPGRFWRLALVLWIVAVSFGHRTLIALAASGV